MDERNTLRPSKRGDFLTDLTHYSGLRVGTCSSIITLHNVSIGRLDVYGYRWEPYQTNVT